MKKERRKVRRRKERKKERQWGRNRKERGKEAKIAVFINIEKYSTPSFNWL